jgi:hypothetical protein
MTTHKSLPIYSASNELSIDCSAYDALLQRKGMRSKSVKNGDKPHPFMLALSALNQNQAEQKLRAPARAQSTCNDGHSSPLISLKQMPPLSTMCSEHRVIRVIESPGEIKKELL